MEISENILKAVDELIRFEGIENLPKRIGNSFFFLAEVEDATILGHGGIKFQGVEYKIGTQK